MNLDNQMHGLTPASANDSRPVSQASNSSTQQRILYKIKSRPKKHERLQINKETNSSDQDGLNDKSVIRSPTKQTQESSNGQPAAFSTRNQEEHIIKSESFHSKISLTPSSDPSTSISGPISTSIVATKSPVNKTSAIMKTPTPKKNPVPSTSQSNIISTSINQQTDSLTELNIQLKESPKQANPNHEGGNTTITSKPNNSALSSQSVSVPAFTWEVYLKMIPAEVAPKEAFMQTHESLTNSFEPHMKLEARDPRNPESWCLASVVTTDTLGVRLRLRLDGGDNSNDFFELIDSENIRPYGTAAILHPPVAYKGSIAAYPKFVDKVVTKSDTVIAPANCFVTPPKRPQENLFKIGMKLEAIDRKHPYLIYPATVGEIDGKDIKIVFDGWRGSFDYFCPYYSRDIFPINWCQATKHYIAAPNGWEQLFVEQDEARKVRSPAPKLILSPNSQAKSSKDSAINFIKPVKTPKSRPKKEMQTNVNSTPKKNTPAIKLVDLVAEEEDEDHNNGVAILDDLEDFAGISKYQCQRTVPYNEWLKSKQNVGTDVLENPNITTTSDQITLNNSSNLSDSASLASTISQPSEGNHISKKSKTEVVTELTGSKTTKCFKNCNSWTVKEVLELIKSDESLSKYANVFENHEIDGKAFLLLTLDIMTNHLGVKLGPALKINDLIEKIKRNK